jgi:hypothetical protein
MALYAMSGHSRYARTSFCLSQPVLNPVISPVPKPVISTEGGALAAAVEKSAVAICPTKNHFGSGSGSTVLIPGRIVDVALNFL